MVEKGDSNHEYQLYRTVAREYEYSEPRIVTDGSANWLPESMRQKYDMLVLLPRTKYDANSNPQWMFHIGPMKYNIVLNGSKYKGCILQIFHDRELKRYPCWDLIPVTNLVLGEHNNVDYYLEKRWLLHLCY